MKKNFVLEELDCANCAAKMQEGIRKIEGVKDCSIAFMTKKMVLEAEEQDYERILKEVKKVIGKVDPEVEVLPA
ncbi:MAG: cation transporter [Lachnospiraceae bacterium]|nr:cation transporter [Lachnospiraceae bacterium]